MLNLNSQQIRLRNLNSRKSSSDAFTSFGTYCDKLKFQFERGEQNWFLSRLCLFYFKKRCWMKSMLFSIIFKKKTRQFIPKEITRKRKDFQLLKIWILCKWNAVKTSCRIEGGHSVSKKEPKELDFEKHANINLLKEFECLEKSWIFVLLNYIYQDSMFCRMLKT